MRILIAIFALFTCLSVQAGQIAIKITGLPEKLIPELTKNLSVNAPHSSDTKQKKPLTKAHAALLYQRSQSELLANLKAIGYFKATLSGSLKPLSGHDQYEATFNVKIGPALKIKSVSFTITGDGVNDRHFSRLFKRSGIQKGHTFDQNNYAKLKSNLLDKAQSLGYFDAKLTEHQVRIDLEHNTAQIIIGFDTGGQYHYGNITFKQEKNYFKESFLGRYIHIYTGQKYRVASIQKLQSELSNTGYFSNVEITPNPDKKTHTVPITIKLKRQKRTQYTLGLGYGTETDIRATLGANVRYVNSTGSHFNIQTQVSKIYSQLTATYIIPGKNPVTDYTSLNAGQNYTNIIPYSAQTSLIGFDRSSVVGAWTRTWGAHDQYIRYIGDNNISGKANYLIPQVNFLYQIRKKAPYWFNGFSTDWLVTGALNKLASHTSYVKGQITSRLSLPVTHSARFFVRVQAGGIATRSISKLPPPLRYYTGGIGSIRGYSYKSLSPKNSNGKLVGGRYLLDGSVNFEHHIYKKLSGIVFVDSGNSMNRFTDYDLFTGAGVGFSYKSPLGPIRLYFSHPVNQPKTHWRIDFTIGTFI